jgi:hypothetical protein
VDLPSGANAANPEEKEIAGKREFFVRERE